MVIDESIQLAHMEILSAGAIQDVLCTLKSTNEYHADPIGYNDSFDKLEPFLYINKKTEAIDVGMNAGKVNELFPMLVNEKSINYIGLINILVNELQWVKGELYKLTHPNGSLDKGVTVKMAQWQHGQITNSTLHIIEDQNHVSPMVELMEDILVSAIQKLKA